MPELAALQQAMKLALTTGSAPAAELQHAISGGSLSPLQRIRVHQNNYRETLTAALLSLFPVAKTFVGEAFLKGALGRYVAADPPRVAVLAHYGDGLPDFLDAFPPTAQVPYLPDIIRLEWAIHSLQVAVEKEPPEEQVGGLKVSPNIRLIDSEHPILNLWMAGTGQIPPEAVHLKSGGQCAMAMLTGGDVRLLALDKAQRTLMLALQGGEQAKGQTTAQISGHSQDKTTAELPDMGALCRDPRQGS